ncbi:MAG: hypothetical protein B6I20_06660 [Bacteroidetes bacterium 4572_117]|nr:MAG: hypothetical protein B6I20_06660 [Bacteroidetes bacterium 4572_117]
MKIKIENDLNQKFSKGTIWLHWLTALLILILVLSSFKIAGFGSIERMQMIKMHLLIGSFVFIFTIIRTYLFFNTKQPEHLKTGSKFIDKLAIWNHYLLYILLFVISIMGIVVIFTGNYIEGISSGSIDNIIPQKEISILKYHVLITFLAVLLVIMHVIGVIKHYIFTKENTLKRIL